MELDSKNNRKKESETKTAAVNRGRRPIPLPHSGGIFGSTMENGE